MFSVIFKYFINLSFRKKRGLEVILNSYTVQKTLTLMQMLGKSIEYDNNIEG